MQCLYSIMWDAFKIVIGIGGAVTHLYSSQIAQSFAFAVMQ